MTAEIDPWQPLPEVSVVRFPDGRVVEVTPDSVRELLQIEWAAVDLLASLDHLRKLLSKGYSYLGRNDV